MTTRKQKAADRDLRDRVLKQMRETAAKRKPRIPVCALGAPNCTAHLPLKVKP